MPTDRSALRALVLAAIASAPLAACGEKEPEDDGATATDTDTDTDSDTDGGGGDSGLSPIPAGDYPECEGETTKSVGPCCTDVYCMDAAELGSTDGSCPDGPSMDYDTTTTLVGTGLGSGTCQCGEIDGPYAPRPEDDGGCCYLVPLQGCEGRPLVIAGVVRRAALVRGPSAWARRA